MSLAKAQRHREEKDMTKNGWMKFVGLPVIVVVADIILWPGGAPAICKIGAYDQPDGACKCAYKKCLI